MHFQADPHCITWRLHLTSSPEVVYALIATNEGRAQFWAESAVENRGTIEWHFPGGLTGPTQVIEQAPSHRYAVEYIEGSRVTFELMPDGHGGTDLTLKDEGVPERFRNETIAGWVSVLLALKAAADFSVDLRNHDSLRTWDQGYVDN